MYARELDGRTLTFGVSGMLYRDALVMYDRQTDTLWTQVDGLAVRGPLEGRRLTMVPSVHATWKEWKSLYPDSEVLRKTRVRRSPYEQYNRDPSRLGIFGRTNEDDRLAPKTRILGVHHEGAAMAFPLDDVRRARIAQAEVGGLFVALAAPGPDLPVMAYERRAGGRTLDLRLVEVEGEHLLEDVGSGTRWRYRDGAGVSGPLREHALRRVTANPAFWFGWRGYFPRTAIWGQG